MTEREALFRGAQRYLDSARLLLGPCGCHGSDWFSNGTLLMAREPIALVRLDKRGKAGIWGSEGLFGHRAGFVADISISARNSAICARCRAGRFKKASQQCSFGNALRKSHHRCFFI